MFKDCRIIQLKCQKEYNQNSEKWKCLLFRWLILCFCNGGQSCYCCYLWCRIVQL